MYEKFGQFIDGEWKQSSDKGTFEVINPATEEIIGYASKATGAAPKTEAKPTVEVDPMVARFKKLAGLS